MTKQLILNLSAVLGTAGSGFDEVIKTTCFTDMAVFADFNKVYGRNFIGKPACSTIAVKTLPYGVIVKNLSRSPASSEQHSASRLVSRH